MSTIQQEVLAIEPQVLRRNRAAAAYRGYCKFSENKSLITGADLPEFDALAQNIQDAWASAVDGFIHPDMASAFDVSAFPAVYAEETDVNVTSDTLFVASFDEDQTEGPSWPHTITLAHCKGAVSYDSELTLMPYRRDASALMKFGLPELDCQTMTVVRADEPAFNAHHSYIIGKQNDEGVLEFASEIAFQKGPVKEHGYNGITEESLLVVLKDRLTSFQLSPYACDENAKALAGIDQAIAAIHERTAKLVARNVEGTSNV